jgi:hypothetical protein
VARLQQVEERARVTVDLHEGESLGRRRRSAQARTQQDEGNLRHRKPPSERWEDIARLRLWRRSSPVACAIPENALWG